MRDYPLYYRHFVDKLFYTLRITYEEENYMAKGILERLADGIVLGDGGYIVELERRGYVVAGAFTP